MITPQEIVARTAEVRRCIASAAQRAGRDPSDVTLVAVTKTHPAALVAAAHAAGLRDVGENRSDEMLEKHAALTLPDLRWHFIGHLQRRKARDLPGHCVLVHSVDRLAIAEELSKRAEAAQAPLDILLQLNTSGEESKSGWPVSTAAGATALHRDVEAILALPALRVRGLMTMAPFDADGAHARPTFVALRRWQERLAAAYPTADWSFLSMGMSGDYEVAIEEGATHVRLGTVLFGERS